MPPALLFLVTTNSSSAAPSAWDLDPAAVRRIAVLRANGVGDFLFVTPALRALAERFPEAEITWIGQPEMVAFVEGRYPYVHRAEVVPFFPTIRRPRFGRFHYDPATWTD